MDVFQQLVDLVTGVFNSVDRTSLIIMVVIVLLAGLVLRSLSHIVTTTLVSLLLFAGSGIARAVIDGAEPMALAQQKWSAFLGMEMGEFLVFFVAFAVVIAGVFLIKSLFQRG